jgi:2-keto-4-pentenoate hydratase/2-oxohepta-3-ene-1,7-dioic acid hydratase in catechol pathway
MKLVSFSTGDIQRHVGVIDAQQRVVDVDDLIRHMPLQDATWQALAAKGITAHSHGLMRWLQAGKAQRQQIAPALQAALSDAHRPRFALAQVHLHAPLARPGKIVAICRNYGDHAKETGLAPFEKPRIISKMPSSVCDPNTTIPIPGDVKKMDFEAELAVVIGELAQGVSEENALQHVAGYTCLNDLSAREFQFDINPAQTTFAKSMDGFCPLGPWLVTADDIPDPQKLNVSCKVNDEVMQQANTHDMLFTVVDLIHYISQYITLEPGDLIATGTPAGVGAFRTPPLWLKPGDKIEVEVSGLGQLITHIR